jgi:cell division protein FtsX
MSYIYNRLHLLILLNILLLIGCSNMLTNTTQYSDGPPPQTAVQAQLNALMLDYAHVENMNSSELGVLHETVKEKFLNEKKDEDRIRYILLLTLPNTKFYNREAALALLKEWHGIEQQPLSFISFRNMLIARLEEEERISGIANRLSQQLTIEKQQTELLQRKVNGIKDMEKTLIRRNIP